MTETEGTHERHVADCQGRRCGIIRLPMPFIIYLANFLRITADRFTHRIHVHTRILARTAIPIPRIMDIISHEKSLAC
jgi:hypothetical protein